MRILTLVTLLSFCATASGCAAHQKLPRPLTPAAVAQVRGALEQRGAWVEHGLPGYPSEIAGVSRGRFSATGQAQTSLVLFDDDSRRAIPLEHVRSLQVNNRFVGGMEGLAVGLLSGALLGVLFTSGGDPKCDPGTDGCLGLDFDGTILLSSLLIGALVGAATGAAVGQRSVYDF